MGEGEDVALRVELRPAGAAEDLMGRAGVDQLLLAGRPLTSVGSTTVRAGRLMPAASVSVQTQTDSSFC